MRLTKVLLSGLLVPALLAPGIAAAAVRPSVKAVSPLPAKQNRAFAGHEVTRASAPVGGESDLVGVPLLLLVAGIAATVALVAVVVTELESSPG